MANIIPFREAPADWSVLGERGHELGVLTVAIEHLRSPSEHFSLSAGGIATLERMAERLRGDLERMLRRAI